MNNFCTYADEQKMPLGMAIKATFDFMAMCPIPVHSKPFGGKITISYTPRNCDSKLKLLEWDSFDEWIKSLRSDLRSAEETAHIIMCKFIEEIDPVKAYLLMIITTPYHLPVEVSLTYGRKK